MVKIYEAPDNLLEVPYPSDSEMEQSFIVSDPLTLLDAINRLKPGEYVIIQNRTPAKSTLASYYCRKEARHINLL